MLLICFDNGKFVCRNMKRSLFLSHNLFIYASKIFNVFCKGVSYPVCCKKEGNNEYQNLLGLPFTEDHALAESLRIKRPRQECFNCLFGSFVRPIRLALITS